MSLRWRVSLGGTGRGREAGKGGVRKVGELGPVSIDAMEDPFNAYYELLMGGKRGAVPEVREYARSR